ncbi:MAG: peptide-methionine (S)-S-oxide reductase [Filomicrobium sp.]
MKSEKTMRAGFGGGCHWCTEAVFQSLRGVISVEQGFIAAPPPNDSLSEAVLVSFDPSEIGFEVLIEIHLRTHSSTNAHAFRKKYRSAVYVFDDEQGASARLILEALQSDFETPLVTQVVDFVRFKPSAEQFQDYYASNPNRPFCRNYIDPKLDMIRQKYSSFARDVAR